MHTQEHINRSFKHSSSDTENELQNKILKSTTNYEQKNISISNKNILNTSSFGRQTNSEEINNDILLSVNKEFILNEIKSNQIDSQSKNTISDNILPINMYYDHQDMTLISEPQPTYYTHQSPKNYSHTQLINLKNKKITPNIQNAVNNTVQALGSLANAISVGTASNTFKNNSNECNYELKHDTNTLNDKEKKYSVSNILNSKQGENMQNNSISVPFNGDRVLMNNVAGSRKPLTGISTIN